jgi:hypothetical protein
MNNALRAHMRLLESGTLPTRTHTKYWRDNPSGKRVADTESLLPQVRQMLNEGRAPRYIREMLHIGYDTFKRIREMIEGKTA